MQKEKRAHKFLNWYAQNTGLIEKIQGSNYDFDLAQDVAIKIHGKIIAKDLHLDSYVNFYTRVYDNARKDAVQKINRVTTNEIPETPVIDVDPEELELRADTLREEYLAFVRANFKEYEIAIFEIYVGLVETTTMRRIAGFLGIKYTTFFTIISRIRTALSKEF